MVAPKVFLLNVLQVNTSFMPEVEDKIMGRKKGGRCRLTAVWSLAKVKVEGGNVINK